MLSFRCFVRGLFCTGLGLAFASTGLSARAAATQPQLAIEATDLGPAFRGTAPGLLGMDGAYSLPLGGGRSLWVFGDTLLGHWKGPSERVVTDMPSTSGAIVQDAAWAAGFPDAAFVGRHRPEAVLRGGEWRERLWPLDLVRVAGRNYMYFVAITATGSGPMDFAVTRSGLATEVPGQPHRFEVARTFWPADAPSFGASVLADRDWLYVYAGQAVTHLARVRPGRLMERTAYTYWAGDRGWRPDVHDAVGLPGSGPELGVRYNPYLKAFVMTYIPPWGNAVLMRLAPAPEGPWSAPREVIRCSPAAPGVMFYGAKQHEELASEHGRQIVVSYNTNAPTATLNVSPTLYWPHLVRVRFDRQAQRAIGPSADAKIGPMPR